MTFAAWLRGRWPPFFAGLLLGAALVGRINRPLPVTTPTPAASPSPTIGAVLGSHNATNDDIPGSPTVTRVIDGDTVELDDGRKVRYLGIDAPEISKHDCFAVEAKAANTAMVENAAVTLERDVTDTDRYGRLLRYVYVNNEMINRALVVNGFALASRYPPDVRQAQTLNEAMAEARTAKRGLWERCPPPTAAASATPPPAGCVIKGNISAKGEKIYHLPDCGSYEKTVIEENKGERWFCTEAEAQAAGWRKAGNCAQ